MNKKNPTIAAILSFFFPGLGNIYNGSIGKGIVIFIVYMLAVATLTAGIGVFLVPLVWLLGILYAHKEAQAINEKSTHKK